MFRRKSKKKIVVGMSGGVDSSVAALLLKRAGYEVIGVFMKNWSGESLGLSGEAARQWEEQCPWERDAEDVRRVCQTLDIPYYTLNFEREYKEGVLDYFFREFSAGRTPNPDVMCNKEVKFKVFLQRALELGADGIATGHYARVREKRGQYQLHVPRDRAKDQTYFLYTLGQSELARTLFPLAPYTKQQVRKIARKYNLVTHNKPDSQGICFVGEVDMRTFLETKIPHTPGKMILPDGAQVGTHEGLAYYTIGQRRGIGVGGAGEPFFVVEKRVATNELVVVRGGHHKALFASSLITEKPTWIAGVSPKFPLRCTARIRYRQEAQKCTVTRSEKGDGLVVTFDDPQRAITPGQSIVFYQKTEVLGGAVIEKHI